MDLTLREGYWVVYPRIWSSLRPFVTFHTKLTFYGEELLASHPTTKVEDQQHLSDVGNCLFNIFGATLYIWRPSPPPAT
jgi:hypothetical protein